MTNIGASEIKELREKTGAGMMDCKKALQENNGDHEAAVDWLRKKGLSMAAKKSGRIASEGLVALSIEANKGAIIELNSETDFVAKNADFQRLAKNIAQVAVQNNADVEQLRNTSYPDTGRTVSDEISELVGVIGENIQLRRSLEISGDVIEGYIHNAVADGLGKIAVIVALKTQGDQNKAKEFAKKIAMHIAATKPEALNVDDLDQALIDRERNVLTEQARESGKPEQVIEKMIEGRIKKFYSEVVLLEQAFVMDGKTAVKDALKEAESDIGGETEITGYIRLTLGEGVEKKDEDFAAEVAAAANG